jgi:hypothetical protein
MISRRRLLSLIAVFLGMILSLSLTTRLSAQEKKSAAKQEKAETKPREDRLSGTIQMINKDDSTITLRKGNTTRTVVYNNDTKFTKRNKPGSLDELKEGRRVICLGKYDDKTRLVASRIDIRTE